MPYVALELIRGYDGNLVNIESIDPKTLYQLVHGGWVQIIDDKIVAEFKKSEILIAEVSE
jgi:hypothetical protein